jgi:hypothetical protein
MFQIIPSVAMGDHWLADDGNNVGCDFALFWILFTDLDRVHAFSLVNKSSESFTWCKSRLAMASSMAWAVFALGVYKSKSSSEICNALAIAASFFVLPLRFPVSSYKR